MARPGRPPRDDLAFVAQALRTWSDEPEEVGFIGHVFTQTSLPYRNPGDALPFWQRENGGLTLTVQPGSPVRKTNGTFASVGYPYGQYPRLLLAWLGTEVIRRQERFVPFGESLADFCRQLGITPSGGTNGPIAQLKDQTWRLLRARITIDYAEGMGDYTRESAKFIQVASGYDLWSNDKNPEQGLLLPSYVELSQEFYDQMVSRPIPVDLRALRALKGAPLRLDIYFWLTYRMSRLRAPTVVSWAQLRAQFGTSAVTRQAQRKFQIDFLGHLARVLAVYPGAHVEEHPSGLRLLPGAPSIGRKHRPALNTPDREVYNPASTKPLTAAQLVTRRLGD